jgi:hypothetical protein
VIEHGRGVESVSKDCVDPQEVGVPDRSISRRSSPADEKTTGSLSSEGKGVEGMVYASSSALNGKYLDGEISRELEELAEVLLLAAVESISPSKVIHWVEIVEVALDDAWDLLVSALMFKLPIPPLMLVKGSWNSTCGEYGGRDSSCLSFDSISRDPARTQ